MKRRAIAIPVVVVALAGALGFYVGRRRSCKGVAQSQKQKQRDVTCTEVAIIAVHVLLWVLFMAGYQMIGKWLGSSAQRFAAGFGLGTYALFAKEIAKYLITAFAKCRLPYLGGPNIRIVLGIGLIGILMAGVIAWYASWEGMTGWLFGLGVFATAVLFDFGISKLFAGGEPFGRPTA